MKKEQVTKLLALLLAGVMTFGMVACGNKAPSLGNKPEESKNEESKVESSKVENVTNNEENVELTYPLNTTDTLTIWTDGQRLKPHSSYDSYKDSPFHTGLAEKTGVEVEWMYPAEGTDSTQAYTLLLTEDVLPDIIFHNISHSDAEQLIEDGVIYDLTEYLPVYAPDYWEWINGDESRFREATTGSGRVPSVSMWIEGDYNKCFIGPFIRQDWLDECGLNTPVTLEDWENVLTTFVEKYDAPFCAPLSYFRHFGFSSGVNAVGLTSLVYLDGDTVKYAPAQDSRLEYLTVLNRWWENGLIDKDMFTVDDNSLRAKMLAGEVSSSVAALSTMTNILQDAEKEGTGAVIAPASYPRTAPGEPTNWIYTTADLRNGYAAFVTTSCPEEKLITALQWLNYGFTEEGMMYWNFGSEGVTYTLNADGEPEFTELITGDADGLNAAMEKYTGMQGNGISIQASRLVALKNHKVAAEAVYTWIENSNAAKHRMPSGVSFTSDENNERADLETALDTYVLEMSLKFISGEESLDNWEEFQNTLKSMGAERLVELYQNAYDRYISK